MSEPAESQPRVEFTLTVDDYLAWYQFALRHDQGLRQQWTQGVQTVRGWLWWCVGGLTVAAFFEYRSWRDSGHVSWAGAVAVTAFLFFGWTILRSLAGYREGNYLATVRKIVEAENHSLLRTPQTLIAADEALINTSDSGRFEYKWTHGVESMATGPDHVYLYCARGCYMIPKRAFVDERAQEAFVGRVRERMAASGGPASARDLRERLKDTDVPCPECGYSLRGLTHARCSECGLQITLDSIKPRLPARSFRMNEGKKFL